MASSNLKLIIQKGPRNGETLEFNPRSTIRIGRVVRGNNLPIKDSGISSKHLEIKFHSDSLKWHITDLDSSNGTIVNSSQLKPFDQFEITTGDEVKIGEFTSIRVEIGEENHGRRNPRRQVASKSVSDSKGKVEEGLNLGDNDGIREENDNRKNPRRQVVSKSVNNLNGEVGEELKLGEIVGIREDIDIVKNPKRGASEMGENVGVNNRGNPKKQAATKKGHESGGEVDVAQEACSNLGSSIVGELEEENVVKGVEGNRRRGRGRTKKVSYNVGVSEDEGNAKLKSEGGVGTRRTRNTRRGEVELLSLDDVMPTRRTRSAKNVEDVRTSSLMEKVVESKGSGADDSNEVETRDVVEKKKTRGGCGRKKVAESLENIQEAVAEEKINHEVVEKECSEKVVNLREQPCDEPADDAPEKSSHDDGKSEQFMEVAVPELERDALSGKEKHCAELMDEFHHESAEIVENVCSSVAVEKLNSEFLQNEISEKSVYVSEQPRDDQHCTALTDETNQQDEYVSLPVKEKHCVELMVEPTQQGDCDAGPSHVEEGVCDGLGNDAVIDDRRTEELEIKEIDKESKTNCYDGNKGPEITDMPDLEKMTLGDWFTFSESYLPKQIRAATDEIIEDMQKRSAQFDEYVLQHQKDKNKLPLAME